MSSGLIARLVLAPDGSDRRIIARRRLTWFSAGQFSIAATGLPRFWADSEARPPILPPNPVQGAGREANPGQSRLLHSAAAFGIALAVARPDNAADTRMRV
jgi:hypothetical protein